MNKNEPHHPMDYSECIHGMSLTRQCYACFANGEDMKRELLKRIAASAAIQLRGAQGGSAPTESGT